jgi:hypothetical protein
VCNCNTVCGGRMSGTLKRPTLIRFCELLFFFFGCRFWVVPHGHGLWCFCLLSWRAVFYTSRLSLLLSSGLSSWRAVLFTYFLT